jgi:hypothetical protein
MKRAYPRTVTFGVIVAAVAFPACASILSIDDAVTIPDDASTDGAAPDVSSRDVQTIPDVTLGAPDADAGSLSDGVAGPDANANDSAPQETGAPCASNILIATAAKSSPNETQPANSAIDGLFSTRWESANGVDPQWIYADFNQPVFINRVEIVWESACAADYMLQVSNDPDPDSGTWSTMKAVTGNSKADPAPIDYSNAVSTTGLAGVGRYMRVYGYIRCLPTYGYSIWEMRAYGDTNAACTP